MNECVLCVKVSKAGNIWIIIISAKFFNTVLMLFSDVVLIVLIVLQPLPGEIRSAKEELQKYIFS